VKSQVRLLDTLDDCIKHPLETISLSAIAGLRSLLDIYFPVASTGPSDRLYKRVVEKYMNVMKNEDNAAATRGFALALGVLPRKLVAFNTASLTSVVSTLCMCSAEDYKVGDETDAETRRNCVNALTEIVETVGVHNIKVQTISPTTDGKSLTTVGMNKDLATLVYSTLFNCLDDYSTDKRGDVGSWVRYASLKCLESLTLTCVKASQGRGEKTVHEEEREGEGEGDIVPPLGERVKYLEKDVGSKVIKCIQTGTPLDESFMEPPLPSFFDVHICVKVLNAVLKQLAEKLDSMRDLAGRIISNLLAEDREVRLPHVVDRGFLTEALRHREGQVNWASPSVVYPMMVKVMNIDSYHYSVVEGLCVSVGGLTESVVKSSGMALVEWTKTMKKLRGWKHLARLGRTILSLLEKYKGNERVVVPLLKTAHLLIKNDALGSGGFEKAQDASDQSVDPLPPHLFSLLKSEVNKSKSYKKIVAVVDVLVGIAGKIDRGEDSENEIKVYDEVVGFLLMLMCHPFPKVRKYCAEQLYSAVLVNEDIVREGGNVETCESVLLETGWDGELEVENVNDVGVRVRRNQLAEAMGVELSEKTKGRRMTVKKAKVREDELASYLSLVKEAGR